MIITSVKGKNVALQNCQISNNLIYAIKGISKDTENEIVSYIYTIAVELLNDALNRARLPSRVNRTVTVMYKNTDLCIKIAVWSSYLDSKYEHGSKNIGFYIQVSPYSSDYINIKPQEIDTILAENALGLSNDQVIVAQKPKLKLYKCLKKKKESGSWKDDLPQALKEKYGEPA
jgi:hypothetical protein